MKKHKAIIVDDEQSARNILNGLLTQYCPQIEIIGTCANVPEAVESIKSLKPEIVFLDIEMPDYAGYEIIDFFGDIDFEIIFVTAYDNYAIKAFEVSAVDYILKPIDIDRLKLSVARFEKKNELKFDQKSYQVLKDSLEKQELTKIVIPHNGMQKIIALKEIIAFEANEAYSIIHTRNDERFIASKNLKHFETLLGENDQFFRTHKSWLINLGHIENYSKSEHMLELSSGIRAKLSKYKKADFELRLK